MAQLAYLAPDAPAVCLRCAGKTHERRSSPQLRNPIGCPLSSKKPKNKRALFPAWAWAAAAALALITGYSIWQMGSPKQRNWLCCDARCESPPCRTRRYRISWKWIAWWTSVMMSPDSKPLKLMPTDKAMPMVHAYLHPHMGVAITAD